MEGSRTMQGHHLIILEDAFSLIQLKRRVRLCRRLSKGNKHWPGM